jgi:hypothetical protein
MTKTQQIGDDMAKSDSPVRIEKSLMSDAGLVGKIMSRSAVQQLEYWAGIGQKLEGILTPSDILEVQSGMSVIKVDPVRTKPVDVDSVFQTIEVDRGAGTLTMAVANPDSIKYQASTENAGYLEAIMPDGSKRVGMFTNGVFTDIDPDSTNEFI